MQHFQHHDYIAEELTRLVLILPQHKEVGYEKAEYERYKAALEKADGFSIPQVKSLLTSSKRAIDFKMAVRHKEDTTAVQAKILKAWGLESILAPS